MAASHGSKLITYNRVVNLSLEIHPDMPVWPGDPQVDFEDVASLETHGYNLRRFAMGEHTGTHINAPSAFYPHGSSIDSYSPESLVVSAVVIDIRNEVAINPNYSFSMEDLDEWEDACEEFESMSADEQQAWIDTVLSTYPSMDTLPEPETYNDIN